MPTPHPHEIGKIVAWGLVVVIFCVFFFYVLHQVFMAPLFDSSSLVVVLSRIVLPVILFSAFLGAFGVMAMITERRLYRTAITFFSSIIPLFFFTPTIWSGIAIVGLLLVLTSFHMTIRGDMTSRIKVKPVFTLAAGLSAVIIALLVPVCLLYYSTYAERPYALDSLRNSLRDSIVDASLKALSSQVDGFSSDATLDQVIANVIAGRLRLDAIPLIDAVPENRDDERVDELQKAIEAQTGQAVDESQILDAQEEALQQQKDEFAAIVTEQLGQAEQQLIAEFRNELLSSMGIEAEGTDSVRSVFTTFVDRRVISLVDPYLHYSPIIFTISLFFVLYIFSFLFRYFTRLFGLLWYWVLRVSHFIFILEKDVKAEYISLEKSR